MGVTLKDVDLGYRALVARVFGFERPAVAVGILDRGAEQHRGEAGLTVLEVAIWNEFGTRAADGSVHVPSRSFVRAWFDENEATVRSWLSAMMRSVLAGKRSKADALEIVAQKCVASMQERIARGVPPPNAPSTADRKGSSTPLIDTGQLRSSITYRITP